MTEGQVACGRVGEGAAAPVGGNRRDPLRVRPAPYPPGGDLDRRGDAPITLGRDRGQQDPGSRQPHQPASGRDRPRLWFQLRAAVVPPSVQLRLVGVNGAQLLVDVTVNGEPLPLLPPLDGADVALQVGSDLLPGVQPLAGWRLRRFRPLTALQITPPSPKRGKVIVRRWFRASKGPRAVLCGTLRCFAACGTAQPALKRGG